MKSTLGAAAVLTLFVLIQVAQKNMGEHTEHRSPALPQPNHWFWQQRAYPTGRLNSAAHYRAVQQAQAARAALAKQNIITSEWLPVGPTNIGGRITALAAHPHIPGILYAGAAAGGVFKSLNGGQTWQSIFDDQPALSIGALAIDPVNPEVVYVGTGEANASGDSYAGNGIYKTINGGASWQHLGLEATEHIGRIAIDPRRPERVYVAASGRLFGTNPERGIYRTTDGGNSWTRQLFLTDSTAAIDVVINPVQSDTVYAAMWERIRSPSRRIVGGLTSGIYRSFDGGAAWHPLASVLPAPAPEVGRIGLTISPSNPAILYAIYADHPGSFAGVFRSNDHGDNWTRTNDGALQSLFSNFGWYFGNIVVDPSDANVVYALGVDFQKSTDGGQNWFRVLRDIHVDQHALEFDAASSETVYVGNDGGVFISHNAGGTWTQSLNLPITQFYAGTIDFLNPHRTYGGTQDNGTLRTTTGRDDDWHHILGGDGFYVIVDYADDRFVYGESQFGFINRSTNGGSSFTGARNGIDPNDRNNWNTPFVIDPQNPRKLYYGTQRLYRTTNRAVSWQPISDDLSDGGGTGNLTYGTITTIAVSPLDSNLIYLGTDDANVWVTKDGGGAWERIDTGLPDRWVTRVAADIEHAEVAYVTFSGHFEAAYLPHIFRTSNQGASWQDIGASLPEAPINDVVIDPQNANALYIATDVGVYFTSNLGETWLPLGTGMPFTPVHDLELHPVTRKLRAATHGRSFFEYDLSAVTGVAQQPNRQPQRFELSPSFPNPVSLRQIQPSNHLNLRLSQPGRVHLAIYNVLGREIKTVMDEHRTAGDHRFHIGLGELPAGIYFYRLRFAAADGFETMSTQKFLLIP